VDDQSFNIQALEIILRYKIGLDTDRFCHSALSGQQALDMVREDFETNQMSRFSLILTDCNMP